MSKFKTRINYVNAKGNPNYYTVTDSTIKDDLLIFSWLVDADVVAYVGTVAFSVNMVFTDENGVTKQAFNTSNAGRLKVLEGIQVEEYVTPEEQADILSRLEADVTKHIQVCIENAKTEVMRYAKNEAVESMTASAQMITNTNMEKLKVREILNAQNLSKKVMKCFLNLNENYIFLMKHRVRHILEN